MQDLIFVIYAEDDKEQAERLYDDLAEKGVRPWMASRDLLPGQNWKLERAAALRRSKCVLVLLSSRTLDKRGFMQKEQKMALAIGDEFAEGDIFVVPVKLDDCDPKNERLAELVPVELFPDYDEGLAKILKVALLGPEEETPSSFRTKPPTATDNREKRGRPEIRHERRKNGQPHAGGAHRKAKPNLFRRSRRRDGRQCLPARKTSTIPKKRKARKPGSVQAPPVPPPASSTSPICISAPRKTPPTGFPNWPRT